DSIGLHVQITTNHPLAKNAAALSIGATIDDYEIRDADSDSVHAFVSRGWLQEISLTDRPANPLALVTQRQPAHSPHHRWHELMLERLELVTKLVELTTGVSRHGLNVSQP